MKLNYKGGILKEGEGKVPYDGKAVYEKLKSFGVKDYKCKKTDSLEITIDKNLTQGQQDELKALLDTMDINKTKSVKDVLE